MELRKIVDGVTALRELNNAKLKINVALTLSKNTDEVQKVLEIFENRKKELIEPLGEKPEEAPLEAQQKVMEEINNLLNEEVDIEIKKIKISDLEGIEISATNITSILWLLDEGSA